MDKVALMFLTRGPMHHERTWRVWLEAAAGLLPRQALLASQEAACDDQTWAQMMAACAPSALSRHQLLGPSETALVQHLFNIYVHALPNFTGACWLPPPVRRRAGMWCASGGRCML